MAKFDVLVRFIELEANTKEGVFEIVDDMARDNGVEVATVIEIVDEDGSEIYNA